ncbi:MAG TPA: hypothetical protein DD379_03725 [Cyanobacteria bacterium UBA11162]|nr:hypothetical protein [Cyanobacteria bacterium UBA11162]
MRSPPLPKRLWHSLFIISLTSLLVAGALFIDRRITANTYFNQGQDFEKQGKLDEAISAYQNAIKLNPNHATAYSHMGWLLHDQNKSEEAIIAYQQALKLNPNDPNTYFSLGMAFYSQEKWNDAVVSYQNFIQLKPNEALAYISLSAALKQQDKLSEAINAYEKAIQLNPTFTNDFKRLGDELAYLKKQSDTLANYRQTIQKNPKNVRAYNRLAKELHKQGKLDQAIATYRHVIQLEPKQATNYNNLGNVLFDQEKFAQAILAYRQAIQLDPKYAIAYNSLGNALAKQAKFDQAISAYQQAIQLNPQQAITYNNIGNALQDSGKLEQAIEQYQRAIALDPKFTGAKDNLQESQRLFAFQKNPQLALLPEQLPPLKDNPLLPLKRAVVRIISHQSTYSERGSGWIVKREGNKIWIVTNRHVVTEKNEQQPYQNIEVEFYSTPPSGQFRKRRPARIVEVTSANDQLDLALLEVTDTPKDIQPLPLSPISIISNQPIFVIGHHLSGNYWTVVNGKISNTTEQELELSAILSSGYSGSPVFDQHNRVVGVAVKVNLSCKPTQKVEGITGCGIAFPIKLVKQKLEVWGIQ